MKNLKLLVLVAAVFVGTQCVTSAIQPINAAGQKTINEAAVQLRGVEENELKAVDNPIDKQVNELMNRYFSNLRTCEPLHWSEYIDLFGLKIGFKIDINGWVENKCQYHLSGKISGIGKDIREVFEVKVTDEDISKIEPIINCGFTQEQLNIIVDAIIAHYEKNETFVSKMLQTPNAAALAGDKKLTPEEEKLVAMLIGGNVCTIPNQEELMQNFAKIMGLDTQPAAAPAPAPVSKSPEPNGSKVNAPSAPVQ